MTEQQLRDVLARVVPEPPDSVADAGPVVRVARRRRQVRVAGVAALAAVLVAGTALGVRAARDEEQGLAVDQPAPRISDPYATAPCPEASEEWPSVTTADLDSLTAVRYCGRPFNGFAASDGAPDALVSELSTFRAAVAQSPEADPGRCAAVDMTPIDSRLLLQLSDGTTVGVPAGPCSDVVIDGRSLDASDVTLAYVAALRAQRDAHDYVLTAERTPLDCAAQGDVTPAAPGDESLVEAVVCSGADAAPTPLDAERLAALDQAWRSGAVLDREGSSICRDPGDAGTTVLARTDRGDTVSLQPSAEGGSCDHLTYTSWLVPLPVERPEGQWLVMLPAYVLPLGIDELVG